MIALDDDQLETVMTLVRPLPPWQRRWQKIKARAEAILVNSAEERRSWRKRRWCKLKRAAEAALRRRSDPL